MLPIRLWDFTPEGAEGAPKTGSATCSMTSSGARPISLLRMLLMAPFPDSLRIIRDTTLSPADCAWTKGVTSNSSTSPKASRSIWIASNWATAAGCPAWVSVSSDQESSSIDETPSSTGVFRSLDEETRKRTLAMDARLRPLRSNLKNMSFPTVKDLAAGFCTVSGFDASVKLSSTGLMRMRSPVNGDGGGGGGPAGSGLLMLGCANCAR